MSKARLYFFLFLGVFSIVAKGQNTTGNSPYSRFGIGDILRDRQVRQFSMAGVSMAFIDTVYANFTNPAMLSYSHFTTFDVGVYNTVRSLKQFDREQVNRGANLNYMYFALPMTPKWGLGFGLSRHSSVDFLYQNNIAIEGDPNTILEKSILGSGGLSRLFLSNGFAITQKLRFGVQTALDFGELRSEDSYILRGQSITNSKIVNIDYYRLRSFSVLPGFVWSQRVGASKKYFMNIGVSHEFNQNLNTKRTSFIERRNINSNRTTSQDTISLGASTNFILPPITKFGIAIQNPGKFGLGIDFTYAQWQKYVLEGRAENFKNSQKIAFGGEWVPNRNAVGKGAVWARSSLRFGFYRELAPVVLDNKRLTDFGMNFGISIPVKRMIQRLEYNYASSTLNIGAQIGRRSYGNETSILRDQYFNIVIGFTILDKWFERYQYD